MRLHIKRLLVISLLCLCFTAITNPNIGIISQFASQNNNDWIGPLSIALLFLGSGLGSLYNSYVRRYRFSTVIFAGAVGWDIFIAFSVIFLYVGFQDYVVAIIAVGSLVCGFIVSLYYNGIFNYVNECGKEDGSVEMYFGVNLCFNQSSNIVGNTLSRFLIEPLGQKTYSLVMMGIGIAVSFCFLLLKQFRTNAKQLGLFTTKEEQPKQSLEQQTVVLLNDQEGKGALVGTALNANQISQPVQANHKQVTSDLGKSKHPWSMVFCYIMSGVMISFVYGQFSILFYKYYKDIPKEQLNKFTFTAFMIEGVGEFFGGLIVALSSKKITNIGLTFCLTSLTFLASISLLSFGFTQDNRDVIYGGAFLVGIADCLCFSLALALGGRWDETGISLFNLGQSGTVAVLSILHIFIDLQMLLIIYVSVFLLSSIAVWVNREKIKG